MSVPGLEALLKAADVIADVRATFAKMEALASANRALADRVAELEKRIQLLEAGSLVLKSETKFEAVKEASIIVQNAQGQIFSKLTEVSLQVDRLQRQQPSKTVESSPTTSQSSRLVADDTSTG